MNNENFVLAEPLDRIDSTAEELRAVLSALHLLYDNVDHDLTPDQLTLPRFGYLVTLKALLTEMESKLDTLDATTKECHDICLNTDKEDIAHDQD